MRPTFVHSGRTVGSTIRGATRFRHCRTHLTDGTACPSDRRCPLSLAPCAGAYWRRPRRRVSVRRLPGPFTAAATPVFHRPPGLCAGARRVLVPFTAHVFSCRGVYEAPAETVKRAARGPAPSWAGRQGAWRRG